MTRKNESVGGGLSRAAISLSRRRDFRHNSGDEWTAKPAGGIIGRGSVVGVPGRLPGRRARDSFHLAVQTLSSNRSRLCLILVGGKGSSGALYRAELSDRRGGVHLRRSVGSGGVHGAMRVTSTESVSSCHPPLSSSTDGSQEQAVGRGGQSAGAGILCRAFLV